MSTKALDQESYADLPSHTKAAVNTLLDGGATVRVTEDGYLILPSDEAASGWSKPICPECGVAPEMVEVHIEWHRRAETQYTATRRRISAVSARASR